jgi:hypothetical protein
MFVLFQINHTTGARSFGPVSRSDTGLRAHLFENAKGVEWSEGGSMWGRDNTPEEDEWEWFSGVSNDHPGYNTTHTAYIRPIKELHSDVPHPEVSVGSFVKMKDTRQGRQHGEVTEINLNLTSFPYKIWYGPEPDDWVRLNLDEFSIQEGTD